MAVTIKVHYYGELYVVQQARCLGGGVCLRFHGKITKLEELGILLAEDVAFYWRQVFNRINMDYVNGHSTSWNNFPESSYVQEPLTTREEAIVQEVVHARLREIADLTKRY